MTRIYPFDLPPDIHPMAWAVLGFGLDGKRASALARHLFDDLGARIELDSQNDVQVSFAVDWPRDPEGRREVSVGDEIDEVISPTGAVALTAGHLPPGVRLEKHTGRIRGTIREPGLYAATFSVGPRVKYDPLGGNGTPGEPGTWIPIGQPRAVFESTPVPETLDGLSPEELEELIVRAQEAQRAQTIKEADDGD